MEDVKEDLQVERGMWMTGKYEVWDDSRHDASHCRLLANLLAYRIMHDMSDSKNGSPIIKFASGHSST